MSSKRRTNYWLTITQIHPIYVTFSVPEQQLPAIRRRAGETILPVKAIVPGDTTIPHGAN